MSAVGERQQAKARRARRRTIDPGDDDRVTWLFARRRPVMSAVGERQQAKARRARRRTIDPGDDDRVTWLFARRRPVMSAVGERQQAKAELARASGAEPRPAGRVREHGRWPTKQRAKFAVSATEAARRRTSA